jgi:transposase
MPVLTAARILEITDKRLWRIIHHYVNAAMSQIDLSGLQAFSLDETKSRKGHRYITVFIDLNRSEHPVVFATPGKGRNTLKCFKEHLAEHGGEAANILEVVSDMLGAFISGIKTHFTNSAITIDWFHVVQLFSRAVNEVRLKEAKDVTMPKATRWATLKATESDVTEKQIDALTELETLELKTAEAWRIKELLRWVRQAPTIRAAKWRLTWFLNLAKELCEGEQLLSPVRRALRTVEKYKEEIIARWISEHSNGRIEALNGLFKAAKIRARGYRNDETFITMIYLLAAPI